MAGNVNMHAKSTSDSESTEWPETFERQPTSSEIFFTPEERQLRKQYRMGKSLACLRESWNLYNKLTDKNRNNEKLEDTSSVLHSFYDPAADRRQLFLQNKFKYLHDGITLTTQASVRPYLLTHRTRDLDSPGRRHVLPRAIRATRPEVIMDTAPPFESTYAYTKQWMNVSNLNFEVIRIMCHASTQTDTDESTIMSKILWSNQPPTGAPDDVKQVDLLDIPLDADGNPIGKRTGFCEWCGTDILPIPTPRVFAQTWDRRTLYCCSKYRQFIEEIIQFEKQFWDEKNENELLIDIPRKVKFEERAEDVSDSEKKTLVRRKPSTLNKWLQMALRERRMSRSMFERKESRRDQYVDTSDLPWDPYETRFSKQKTFNDFDDVMQHVYRHAEIVLHQEEIYTASKKLNNQANVLASD